MNSYPTSLAGKSSVCETQLGMDAVAPNNANDWDRRDAPNNANDWDREVFGVGIEWPGGVMRMAYGLSYWTDVCVAKRLSG